MLGRLLIIDTGYQTVSVVQDLLEVKLGTAQAGYVIRAKIMQSSEEAASEAEELKVSLKKAAGSFTSGSGGGTTATVVTPSNSLAHGLAARENNNTTQAVAGSGTLEEVEAGVFNVLAGEWEWTPTPELMDQGKLGPSEAAVLSLEEAPADAITMRATLTILLTHG